MINDPKVQEFIAQNPEVKAFFDAQMAGMDPSSEEAKDKVLNLMGQFRRQMEEQGYGRDHGDVFGGYVDGGETATTPSSEQDHVATQGLTGMGKSYRADDGRTEVSGSFVDVNKPADNGVDLNTPENTSSTPTTSKQQNQGIDTVLNDLDKEDQAPGVQKNEQFFESKYKNFFDSDKGKEAWKKFTGGLKGAKTIDDLFSVMVFGMLNFPFDMINSYCDHRKAEAKRMEEEFMKKIESNHSSAMGRHHDTTETFIKKMSDVNNNAVSESDPKLWESMQKVGVIDKYGNVDKTKLKEHPDLASRYNELSDSIGRQARDNFVQSYDRTNIPHDHPVWKKYSNEMDRLFKTTQAVGGVNRENEQQRPSEPEKPAPTQEAPQPAPVPANQEELNRLREENAYVRGQRDAFREVALGRANNISNVTIINNTTQNEGTEQTTIPGQDPVSLLKPQRLVTGDLSGNYYTEISSAFNDIRTTLDNDRLTQRKLEHMFESRRPDTGRRVMERAGGAAQDFGRMITDSLGKGEITLDQAKGLLTKGLDILSARKSKGGETGYGLECLEQMVNAKDADEMSKIYENHKESIKARREAKQNVTPDAQKADQGQKKDSLQPAPKPAPEKSAPVQEAPKRPSETQAHATEILKASSEKGAELSAKEYKTEGGRKTQMTRANNKILDQMLGGMKKADQSKVLKALHEQILAQAKEKGLDANAQNLQRAVENRCKDLSGRKMAVSKRMTDNKIKQDIVAQVKENVPAKRAVQMARTNTVRRTIPPMMRSKGNENA